MMRSKRIVRARNGVVLEGVEPALRRSRQRARDIAARTNTPLVIYHAGKIERRKVTSVGRSKSN